jgi:hypothetical protein
MEMDSEVFIFCVNSKSVLNDDGYILLISRLDAEGLNCGPFFSFEEVLRRNEEERYGILKYNVSYLEIIKYGALYERAINKFNKLKIFI